MMRLQHVNVVVPSGCTEAVVSFYSDVLGLHRVAKPAEGVVASGVWFAVSGGTQVHVSERAGERHPDQHFALVVDDYDVVVPRVAASAPWTDKPALLGARRGMTADPAGNAIELIEAVGAFATEPLR